MRIDADVRMPNEAEVLLDLPRAVAEPMRHNLALMPNRVNDRIVARMRPHGIQKIGEMEFPAKMAAPAHIWVNIPKKLRENEYDIIVRQTYEGREVGRITWRLSPRVQERPKKRAARR